MTRILHGLAVHIQHHRLAVALADAITGLLDDPAGREAATLAARKLGEGASYAAMIDAYRRLMA